MENLNHRHTKPLHFKDVEDEDYQESDKNVVPVDRNIDTRHSQEIEYSDDEYYDESEMDGFIPADFASKLVPTPVEPVNSTSSTPTNTKPVVATASSTVPPSTSSTSSPSSTTKMTTSTTTTSKPIKAEPTVGRPRATTGMPTVPTRRLFTPPVDTTRLTKPNTRPIGTNSRAGIFTNDRTKPNDALNTPNGPVYLSPQDNEIADSSNVKNNVPPNVNEPQNKIESESQDGFTPKLNLGMPRSIHIFQTFDGISFNNCS